MCKKIICFAILMFLLCGCSSQGADNAESEPDVSAAVAESAAPITSTASFESAEPVTNRMSEEVYNRSLEDIVKYVETNGTYMDEFAKFLQNNVEAISGEEINLSEIEGFCDFQKEVIRLCDEMMRYDTSEMSEEMQHCFELLAKFAAVSKKHWEDIGKKISPGQFEKISYEYQEAFSEYLSELFTCQIKAMIAYMEENNGDPETIANLKKSIGEETTNSGNSSNNNSSGSASSNSSGCGYKYSSGKVCGAKVGSHAPLCDKHFKELNNAYNALTGNK